MAAGAQALDGDLASVLVTFKLNAKGTSSNVTSVVHDVDGDFTVTGNTLSIETLNADGSGTVKVICGVGCEQHFNFQVSPDRTLFSLVDVAAGEDFAMATGIHP